MIRPQSRLRWLNSLRGYNAAVPPTRAREERPIEARATKLVCAVLVAVVVGVPADAWAQPASFTQTPAGDLLPPAIPLFPLQDVMLFPGMSRPLHIFEARYREMVTDVVQRHGYIGMVLLQPGYEADYEGNPPIFPIGCAGEIIEAEELADGRWLIVLRGTTRFRVVNEDHGGSYRVAEVEPLEERRDSAAQAALSGLRAELTDVFTSLAPNAEPSSDLSDEDLVNGLAQLLALDPADRQVLLEAAGPFERAEALLKMVQ